MRERERETQREMHEQRSVNLNVYLHENDNARDTRKTFFKERSEQFIEVCKCSTTNIL